VTNIRHSIEIIFHKFSRRYPPEHAKKSLKVAAPPASRATNKNRSKLNNFNFAALGHCARSTLRFFFALRHKINVDTEAHEKLSFEVDVVAKGEKIEKNWLTVQLLINYCELIKLADRL
jgi:hypothetical protein